jgi:hypothetical protein
MAGELTSQADPRATVEGKIAPFGFRSVVLERHILVPTFRAEQLSIHSIKIRPSVHRIYTKSHCASFEDEYWRRAIWSATSWKHSGTYRCASVHWDRRVKPQSYVQSATKRPLSKGVCDILSLSMFCRYGILLRSSRARFEFVVYIEAISARNFSITCGWRTSKKLAMLNTSVTTRRSNLQCP